MHYNSFIIKKLSQADGLSQGSNYFLHEDKLGFMWITANDAINRYDGSWVKVYKEDRYFKNCPVLKQGYGFAEDDNSNLYIGSTIGLYIYNRSQDDFTLLKVFTGYADENCIPFAYHDHKIWCYNRFYAIAAIDVTTGSISFYKDVKADPIESIHTYMFYKTGYRYRQPFFDSAGTLWITTSSDIISYLPVTKQASYYLHNEMSKQNIRFTAVCYDESQNRLIAGTGNGIIVFNLTNHTSQWLKKIGDYESGRVDCIKQMNHDFVVSGQNAVIILSGDFQNVFHLDKSNNPEFETSVSEPVCVDKIDRLWLCKNGSGLRILDFAATTLSKESGYKEDPDYFFKRGTHGFVEYPDGSIMIRSGAKLFIKNKVTSEINQLRHYNGSASSLSLCNDYKRNGIWLSSHDKLMLLNCLTNKAIITIGCSETQYGIMQDIAVLPSGDVLVALSTGVYSVDFINKKLVPVKNLDMPNAFKLNVIDKDRIAISYLNSDMLLVKMNNANSASILNKILPGINSFYLVWNSTIHRFLAGTDDGVYLLDENFIQSDKLDATSGLSGTYIYGLLLDDVDNVWVSHEKGLSCINLQFATGDKYYFSGLKIINYDEDDNIQDRDYNNRSFFKSKNGTLYFGGIKGYNSFKPPLPVHDLYKAELYVEDISINNTPVYTDSNCNYIDHLKLSSQQSRLNIHAVIKDLDMIHSNEIAYRFVNLDTPWKYLPASSSNLIFDNLAPGDYKLELGYHDTKQDVLVSQKTISISIAKPFYLTILFWVFISVVATALLVWNINNSRLKKQKRLYLQQEALMKERNRITSDLHDDVGSSLSSLQIHSTLAKRLLDSDTRKAKDYLDKVIQQSSDINSNISDIIWSMKASEDRLVDMDGRIRNTVSNLLGATSIGYTIEIAKDLDKEVRNILARKNIMLLIKEAINNCAKYSGATHCKLSVTITEDYLSILVSDNGKGIAAEKMKMGNGMQNMRKRAEELKGYMYVKTAENKGVELKFVIPATEIRG